MKPKKPTICQTIPEKINLFLFRYRHTYSQKILANNISMPEWTFSNRMKNNDFRHLEIQDLNRILNKYGFEL